MSTLNDSESTSISTSEYKPEFKSESHTRIEKEKERRKPVIPRVKAVDPNGGRCLVENCDPSRGVENCYVIPRKFWGNSKLLDSLEWHWGMRNNTLNLETRWNIFPADRSIHGMYDAGQWILVPEETIVQQYYDALVGPTAFRNTFPRIEEDTNFKYRLIPLKNMDHIAITRQDDTSIPLTPGAFSHHLYPFTTLPTLISHIHPKFAIVLAGIQLHEMVRNRLEDYVALTRMFPSVMLIVALHEAWTAEPPNDAESDESYWPPYKPSDNDDEVNLKDKDYAPTEKGRYTRKKPIEETLTKNRTKSSNMKSGNFSRASIREHTRTAGKIEWNKDAVVNWSSNCEPPDMFDMSVVSTEQDVAI